MLICVLKEAFFNVTLLVGWLFRVKTHLFSLLNEVFAFAIDGLLACKRLSFAV